mmetsp:Transcript_15494/g.19821  ORF Transcript_15494/g.19821 Transcript_15494/m.19821 type:complete len:355 (+) Transcript_15494:114-1178(+)
MYDQLLMSCFMNSPVAHLKYVFGGFLEMMKGVRKYFNCQTIKLTLQSFQKYFSASTKPASSKPLYDLEEISCSDENEVLLMILRHGESEWNNENRFTSWVDKPLTKKGREQARHCAALLKQSNLRFDSVHTSLLRRAQETVQIILDELSNNDKAPENSVSDEKNQFHSVFQKNPSVNSHWRLNERHYGALIGMNKVESAKLWGEEQVKLWRRSLNSRPPAMTQDHPWFKYIQEHQWYKDAMNDIPCHESLEDVISRVLPYWMEAIASDIKKKRNTLVVTHSNVARALITHLEGLKKTEILELNIPNGVPIIYKLNSRSLQILSPRKFLGNPEKVQIAIQNVASESCLGDQKKMI